ncbi:MAG: hypothetical protein IPM55_17850 [Acidobacteria bacterium]|nr:hypothetical protein [Acidobacteriota bacterium]
MLVPTACLTVSALHLSNSSEPHELRQDQLRLGARRSSPLVARFGEARVSLPGGCHRTAPDRPAPLMALERGCTDRNAGRRSRRHGARPKGANITFETVTVTGTENVMMRAALADG